MRIRHVFLLIFISISHFAKSQTDFKIDWNFTGQTFEEFAKKAETEYNLRFFYNEDWIKDIKLDNYGQENTLTGILDSLFRNKNIYYYINGSDNVILTKNFAIKPARVKKVENQSYIPGIDYNEVDENKNSSGNIVIDVGNPADRNKTGNVTISGYIKNRDTKEVVPGVTVYIPKLTTGAISNAFGFFTINIPRGSYSAKFSFIGMKERTIDLNIYGSGEIDVEMRSVLVPLKEAIITADKNVTLQRNEVGVEKINISSFKLQPTSLGESDITKSMLLIPGVQSVGEGSAGFNVRGGSADQNLILLYGAPIYNSSHFFGFFSTINSDIIKDVTLYKGGIPSRYGGRLASVLDITPRDGNRKEFAGNAGISPVTTHIALEGPIKKDTLYYLITARTTYSNWLLGMLNNSDLSNSSASFYDINARLSYDINKNNKIDLSVYHSFDSFRFNSDTTYKYENNIVSIKYRHYFNSRFFTAFSVYNSNYSYDISSSKNPQEAFILTHKINSTGLKADFNWFTGRNEFNFGLDAIHYNVTPGNMVPWGDSSLVVQNKIELQKALESALYLEDKYALTDNISVNAGLRFVDFFALGPQTLYNYNPEYPRSLSSITDTIQIRNSRKYKTYSGPELRLSANIRLNNNSSFKINYNRTRQYLHLLSNTVSISPNDIWKLSDYYVRPQICDQIAAGYYRLLNNNKIEASVELYYKKIQNMIDFKGGTDLLMNEYVERDLINVDGRAYGAELLIKKPEGRVRWSISYTYSKILLRSKSNFIEEMINSGNWFPANFDKPHDLIMTFNYLYSRRINFSANYCYSSGRPVTYPISTYNIGDIVLTNFSDRNKYRIPDYSRLDLSLTINGNLKSKKIAHPHWIFSLYNVTGRQNVYSVFFRKDKNVLKGYYLSVFGRPIPSVSFNFDF
jgi:hypothetical protein